MTEKQVTKEKREIKAELSTLKITLEYSIRLLEDDRGDLKIELKDLDKTIKKAKNKLKALEGKI